MMGHRGKAADGFEQDAFSRNWRRWLSRRAGKWRKAKQSYARRQRRLEKERLGRREDER